MPMMEKREGACALFVQKTPHSYNAVQEIGFSRQVGQSTLLASCWQGNHTDSKKRADNVG